MDFSFELTEQDGNPFVTLKENIMKGILLWMVGVPIPLIILLYIFNIL